MFIYFILHIYIYFAYSTYYSKTICYSLHTLLHNRQLSDIHNDSAVIRVREAGKQFVILSTHFYTTVSLVLFTTIVLLLE